MSLRDPRIAEGFVEEVRASIQRSISNEALLYGRNTEAMFEALVASLGRFAIFKQEDVGEIYAIDSITEVPDFRVVTPDGRQLLIEVKNCFREKNPTSSFQVKATYVAGLCRFAKLVNADLRLAIYWAKWNMWTLVPETGFDIQGDAAILPFLKAAKINEMAMLGDVLVGTRFPLSMRLVADPSKSRQITEEGRAEFVVGAVELYSAGQLITSPIERRIAQYLMFYGDWQMEGPIPEIEDETIKAVKYAIVPIEDHGQGFEIIGSLSSMFSSYYRQMTFEESGRVRRLRVDVSPGGLGRLIPEEYAGKALPLWRLIVETS